MKRGLAGLMALLFLAAVSAAPGPPLMTLADQLVFTVPDPPATGDAEAFVGSVLNRLPTLMKNAPGWTAHLVRKDRGPHAGRYGVVWTAGMGAAPLAANAAGYRVVNEYRLVGADKLRPLPDVDVLGIHYIKVRPERRDAFDRLIVDKLHPAVGNLRPDLRLLYYKSVRGEDVGSYITIFALTQESRDKYWPNGSDSEELKTSIKAAQALTEELKTYLVEGSYATGNLAAAVYESKEWADWVLVPAGAPAVGAKIASPAFAQGFGQARRSSDRSLTERRPLRAPERP
jgi:hypothetical protein